MREKERGRDGETTRVKKGEKGEGREWRREGKMRGEGAKDRKGDERERDKEDVGWGVGGEG